MSAVNKRSELLAATQRMSPFRPFVAHSQQCERPKAAADIVHQCCGAAAHQKPLVYSCLSFEFFDDINYESANWYILQQGEKRQE